MSLSETWPGKRLGLAESGPGSLAGFWRRVAAICLDWLAAYLLAATLFRNDSDASGSVNPWSITIVFLVVQVASVAILDGSPGQLIFKMRVLRLDGTNRTGLLRSAVRAALLCLLIPAVIWDADGRGLHDKAAGTALVRYR